MQALVELVLAFFDRISEKIFKKPRPDRQNMVYLPDHSLLAGILCAVVFTAAGVLPLILEDDGKEMWFISVLLFAFALMGVALVIAYFNCRITFRDHDFTYKNFFGVKKTIQYRDLAGILEGNHDIKLYAGDISIYINEEALNKERFLALAKKRYRESHNGKMIPKATKKDIFNNHVEDPQSFILVFVMLAVFFTLLTIGVITISIPESREDFSPKSITVARYEISDDHLYIYDSLGAEYRVFSYADVIEDSSELISNLSPGASLYLSIILLDSDEDCYSVSSIEMNGKSYMTYDSWYDNASYNFRVGIVLSAMCDLFIFFFIGGAIYVGRNPHKFSDRVLHLFFRPGTIHRD